LFTSNQNRKEKPQGTKSIPNKGLETGISGQGEKYA
jgi:hypothetical protein